MEENTRNSGHGLGVAALVLGILSFVVAFIPCIGFFALFTALIAIVLGAIGLSQASKDNSPKGLMLAGLIIGVIALFISIAQVVLLAGLSDKAGFFEEKFEEVIDEFGKDVLDEFEDGSFSIIINDGEDKIEIKSSVKKELRDRLDELEDLEDKANPDKDVKVDVKIKIDSSGGEKLE